MPHTARRIALAFTYLMATWLVAALPAAAASPKNAPRQALVRAADIGLAAATYGFQVLSSTPEGVHLVTVGNGSDAGKLANAALGDGNVISVEAAEVAYLQAADPSSYGILAQEDVAPSLARFGFRSTPCLDTYLSGPALEVWAGQYSATLAAVEAAQAAAGGCGEGTVVALIDTGVDADHELLAGALLPGYDFLLGNSLASEWSTLDNSFRALVENSFRALVENSFRALVEDTGDTAVVSLQTMAPILAAEDTLVMTEVDLPAYFGHGTMVAGLVRLVAPGAKILPLRVFDGNGEAHGFDIVRAVYYAVDHGADVINMSFSMEGASRELAEALRYARSHGVVTVAAAGNQGERTRIYPAAFTGVVGVAATDEAADPADFSNYGTQIAHLAAPGVATISSFPGGLYAAGYGTSFASPMVAGTFALLQQMSRADDTASQQGMVLDLLTGTTLVDGLESEILAGRLDSYGAVVAASN